MNLPIRSTYFKKKSQTFSQMPILIFYSPKLIPSIAENKSSVTLTFIKVTLSQVQKLKWGRQWIVNYFLVIFFQSNL